MLKKYLKAFFVIVMAGGFLFFAGGQENKIVQAAESDAVAVRVIANPQHYGPLEWYKSKGFKGSPTTLTVDGYEAIRDGRTVFVNVANIAMDGKLYTNIYLISYNQNAKPETIAIFNNILSRWKFNTNLSGTGNCFYQPANSNCLTDADCTDGGFCDSLKARIVRDTKRLADVMSMRLQIENYFKRYGHFPLLKSGSYITGQTVSTWPSWEGEFSSTLGAAQPIDPINKLGNCGGTQYESTTCWDDKSKTFAGTIPGILPANSRVYVYSTDIKGKDYTACALMESGLLIGDVNGACQGSVSSNNPPTVSCGSLVGIQGQELIGYVGAVDQDGDPLTFSFSSLPAGINVFDTNDPNKKMITSLTANQVGKISYTASAVNLAAVNAVVAYEGASLTTMAEITVAEALGTAAVAAVSAVTDVSLAASLTARIAAQDATVAAQKAVLQIAVVQVAVNNCLAAPLTTFTQVAAAKSLCVSALASVNALPNSPSKTALLSQVTNQLNLIVAARVNLYSALPLCASPFPPVDLSSFSATCQGYFNTVITAINARRYAADMTLRELSGNGVCDGCVCGVSTDSNGTGLYPLTGDALLPYSGLSATCKTNVDNDMNILGISPAAIGGLWFVWDQNENDWPSCMSQDIVYIYSCGWVRLPFYTSACGGPQTNTPTCRISLLNNKPNSYQQFAATGEENYPVKAATAITLPAGTYPFNVTVSDGVNSPVTQSCDISITSSAFIVYPIADQKQIVGKSLDFSIYAGSSKKDYSSMNFSFSANPVAGAPSFSCALPLAPLADGRVQCDVSVTPTAVYSGVITVSAANGADMFTSQAFKLTIYNNPPVMQPVSCPTTVRLGEPLLSCSVEATDPDGQGINSISASGLPNNISLRSFSTDPICEKFFEKIIDAVVKKRYEQDKVLKDVTGNNCSDCTCWVGTSYYNPAVCAANRASNMALFGFTTADLGGKTFNFDENEQENSLTSCTNDYLYLDGCGNTPIPPYKCPNPSSVLANGSRATLQGAPNVTGTFPITFTATDQFGLASNPLVFSLKINDYCGDAIKQTPNTEGKGGISDDGYEDCDCGGMDYATCASAGCVASGKTDCSKTESTTGVPTMLMSSATWQYGCSSNCATAGGGFCGDNVSQDGRYNEFKTTGGKQALPGGLEAVHDRNNYGEQCDFGTDINCCNKCNWVSGAYINQSFPDTGNLNDGDNLNIALPPNRGAVDITFTATPYIVASLFSNYPLGIVVISDISNPPGASTIPDIKTSMTTMINDFYNWSIAKSEDIMFGAFGFGEGNPPSDCPGHFCFSVSPDNLLNNPTHQLNLINNVNLYTMEGDASDYRSYIDLAVPQAANMLNSLPPQPAPKVYSKYMIILTDACACSAYDAATTNAINAAKNAGIKIYTVFYGANPSLRNLLCSWSSDSGTNCYANNFSYDSNTSSINAVLQAIKNDIVANIPQQLTISANVTGGTAVSSPSLSLMPGASTNLTITLPAMPGCGVDGDGCDKSAFLLPSFSGVGYVTIDNISINLLPACAVP